MPTFISGTLPIELTQASGIAPLVGLEGDQLLCIGDKGMVILSISDATVCFNNNTFAGHFEDLGKDLGGSLLVNDMEDVAWDAQKSVAFVLVSGSKSSKNQLKSEREKFACLSFDKATRKWMGQEVPDFKNQLLAAFPDLKELAASPQIDAAVGGVAGTFNLEGLALLPDGKLLFGFRSPTHPNEAGHPAEPGDAIVVTLTNPHAVFDGALPKFEANPQYFNLGGQGIRGMHYDAELNGCWIVAGESYNGTTIDKKVWSLWFWDRESAPIEKSIAHGDLRNAEGVCRMDFNGQKGLLLIEDAGKKNGISLPCKYLLTALPK